MRLNTLDPLAAVANWVLAGLTLAGAVLGAVQGWEGGWAALVFPALYLLLAVGVALRVPLAYIGVITFALLSLAMALNRGDLPSAAVAALLLAGALFVRGRLRPAATPAG